ncbi:MAG: hypothetical protein ACOVOO_00030 [Flavobacteriales bacterium]
MKVSAGFIIWFTIAVVCLFSSLIAENPMDSQFYAAIGVIGLLLARRCMGMTDTSSHP